MIHAPTFPEGEIFLRYINNRFNKNKNFIGVTTGPTGCLSGDTELKISRAKSTKTYKIKDLYIKANGLEKKTKRKPFDVSIPLFIRSFNGTDIRLHKIERVIYSGEKPVYEMLLKNGLSIRATNDHKIMTQNGWTEIGNMNKGDLVMCDTPNAKASNRKRIKLRDIGLCVGKNYPYNIQPNEQIDVHRLIYEARMNSLEFTEYLDILLNEPEKCKELKYINPKENVIHHKDGNHYNNSIDNLEKISSGEHKLKHNNYSNFSQGVPKFSEVESISFVGEEDTYDISCEEPHHNFVANNIVVHNSGKSYLDLRKAELQHRRRFKEEFPIKNVCFSVAELMERISSGELRTGEILILEEAGVNIGSGDWQNKIVKMFNYILQSFRSMNVGIFMNLPVLSMMSKQARLLTHMHMETVGIDFELGLCKVKPLCHQLNQHTGKSYWKYMRVKKGESIVTVQRMAFGMASDDLIKRYEDKKEKFLMG